MTDATGTDEPGAAEEAGPAPTTTAPPAPAPETPSSEKAVSGRVNRRKTRDGTVVSAKMDKTVIVVVVERVRHPRYQKTMQRTKRLYAHDEQNDVKAGDRVRIQETRPLSHLKRWRVVQVLERAR
jgi:small subunit ribosomal protein S17